MPDSVHANLLPTGLLKDRRETQPIASIAIDCAQEGHDYARFWQSTGFSAAVLSERADMRQTLALCRGMAHGGFQYIRPHYLLNLVVVPDRDADTYDWRRLDAVIDSYVANDFKLIFELMGYPAKCLDQAEAHSDGFQTMDRIPETCFDDLDDPEQVRAWYRLVRALAEHLLARYGAEELRSWWFETWNEPNIKFWKWSYAAFLTYWDACSEALRAVDPALRFGGPGNHVAWSEHLFDTLQHCRDGENFITGGRGSRIDFISIHCKGPSDHVKFGEEQELAVRHEIASRFPEFAELPFFNDECDPVTGWRRELWWHAGAYYPAWVARSVAQGLSPAFAKAPLPYHIMSSDNTFMGNFGQRTLHHRFADADGQRVSLIGKAVSKGMALINRLRGPALPVAVPEVCADRIAIAATRSSGEIALLVSNLMKFEAEEFQNNTISPTLSQVRRMQAAGCLLRLELSGITLTQSWLIHYRIDDEQPDAFRAWQDMGQPQQPSAQQLDQLRRAAGLDLIDAPRPVTVEQGCCTCHLYLPSPAISLLLVIERPPQQPPVPELYEHEDYTGIDGRLERFLHWQSADSSCIRRWEIAFQAEGEPVVRTLSDSAFIDTVFVHACEPGTTGSYRVRGIDFWGRASNWSESYAV